jgi:hypothetical protein
MVRFPRLFGLVVRFLVPAVALALVLSACSAERPVAAVVDGERVTDQQLARDETFFSFLAAINQQSCGNKKKGESQHSACVRYTLSTIIQEDLIKHYATAHGITVPESKVSTTLSQIEAGLGTAKLEKELKSAGMTRADLTSFARRLLLFSEVQGWFAKKSVTQAQLRRVYEQQILQFTQIHVRHILVKTRAEADRIERQVTPANFGELAKKYSIDSSSAKNGGDLGTFAASALDSTFAQAALALRPGGISAPVHTQYGWHIIELVSVKVTSFSKVESQLRSTLASQAFTDWLGQRVAKADITVNPKYGRLNRTTGEIVPIRSTATTSSAPSTSTPTASVSATP